MISQIKATEIVEKVINYMLAPDYMASPDDGNLFRLKIDSDETELHLYLKWSLDFRETSAMYSNPERLPETLRKMLEPISKRITYGEVEDLRKKNKWLADEMDRVSRENSELRRYKDALQLMRGSLQP